MDPDVRSNVAGVCERCGMKLVSGIPDPAEYTLDLNITPQLLKVNQPANFEFIVRDPWKDCLVAKIFRSSTKCSSTCSWSVRI